MSRRLAHVSRRLLWTALSFTSLASCDETAAPRPQWLVTVATDAPTPAFGDRVLIEIFDREGIACSSCKRAFGAASVRDWPFSFGIDAATGAHEIRARFFRASTLGPEGTPLGGALIDVLATLPPDPEGVHAVALELRASCFGVPADVDAGLSCDPRTGQLAPQAELGAPGDLPAAGSWAPALEVACPADAAPEMVCIPGGVFVLGAPDSPPVDDPRESTTPERLVQIAPFFLDRNEMTVGDYLRLREGDPTLPEPVARDTPAFPDADECTYRPETPDEGAPLNCVSRELAERLCAADSKRFPTEAEWEHAASNRGFETTYPWGSDDDICARAVVARGVIGVCLITDQGTLPRGPVAGGSARDVNDAGALNLGGNLSEWVADAFEGYGQGCWAGGGLVVNPRCDAGTGEFAVRGGNWAERPISARSAARRTHPGDASALVGVRCALTP